MYRRVIVGNLKFQGKSGVGFLLVLEGTDPPKGNAQAARCTGGVKANGWDRISSAL